MSLHLISGLLVAHGCASTQVRAPESSPLCTILINTLSMISYAHGAYIVETVTPTLTYDQSLCVSNIHLLISARSSLSAMTDRLHRVVLLRL